jgi:hypothetical protein
MGRRFCFASIGQEKVIKKYEKREKKVNTDALGKFGLNFHGSFYSDARRDYLVADKLPGK